MRALLIGSAIRERRKASAITQVALAKRLGISASYLNLIEADRRHIGGGLLKRIADELGVPMDQFGGAAERRLIGELGQITTDPLIAPLGLDDASASTLASRNPGWARAMVSLYRAYVDRSEAASVLADRLNQDPMVSETVHNMLTNISAIRSAAEILDSEAELEVAQRQRFVSIIAGDSRRLSQVSQALVGLFAKSPATTRSITPVEEVDDFIAQNDNHFPALERAAEDLRARAGWSAVARESELARYLRDAHGIAVHRVARLADAGASARQRASLLRRDKAVLELRDNVPPATQRFEIARAIATLDFAGPMATEMAGAEALQSAAARSRAEYVLSSYLAAAILMSYRPFFDAAVALRYDLDRLAHTFGSSFEQVAHRLVTLRAPGASGIRFGFLRSDAAGHITKRFALPRLALPRQGGACPLWAVFTAFQAPGSTVRQLAEFPGGDRYLLLARAVEKEHAVYGMPRHFKSVMLMCELLHADQTLYGDGVDLSPGALATPVGQSCRVCVRRECSFRQEAPIVDLPTLTAAEG